MEQRVTFFQQELPFEKRTQLELFKAVDVRDMWESQTSELRGGDTALRTTSLFDVRAPEERTE